MFFMTNITTANLCPNRDLNAYIAAVYQIPMLSKEEETQLAEDLVNKGELESAQKLVLAHLRVVVSVSRQYLSYGLSQADIIQEGNVGLMKAVKRFDPSNGARLFSFAIHWIKAEIHDFILRNWKIVKVATTKAQRKMFFNLRSAKKKLLRALLFLVEVALLLLAEEGRATHGKPEVGRRVVVVWPYYFLQRRGGEHMPTQRSAGA